MKDWQLAPRPQGFVVVNGDREPVSPGFSTPEAALDWVNRRAAAQPQKLRPCLCCGRSFASRGRHNRMCALCIRDAAGGVLG